MTIYKESSTVPVTGSDAYKGKAAKMYTYGDILWVGAAAGNLFIGTYKTNVGNLSRVRRLDVLILEPVLQN